MKYRQIVRRIISVLAATQCAPHATIHIDENRNKTEWCYSAEVFFYYFSKHVASNTACLCVYIKEFYKDIDNAIKHLTFVCCHLNSIRRLCI